MIFLAIEAKRDPDVDKARYSEIVVWESATEWTVFRGAPLPAPRSDGLIEVPPVGGGTLSINIDKCSGGISKAYFQK